MGAVQLGLPDETPVLEGERVVLRSPRDSDVQDRMRCGHDPEVVRGYGVEPLSPVWVPMDEAAARAWVHAIEDDPNPLHWVIEHEGRLVGACRLHSLDPSTRTSRHAIGIEERSLLGQGLGTEATRLVLTCAFEQVGLSRVEVRVLDSNERAIRCYRRCGFEPVRRELRAANLGGEWHDDLILAVDTPGSGVRS